MNSTTIKVGNRTYTIKALPGSEIMASTGSDEVCGYTDYHDSTIVINDSVASDLKQETVVHELIHVLLDNGGIEQVCQANNLNESVAELIATVLAPRLHALLVDNPQGTLDQLLKQFR